MKKVIFGVSGLLLLSLLTTGCPSEGPSGPGPTLTVTATPTITGTPTITPTRTNTSFPTPVETNSWPLAGGLFDIAVSGSNIYAAHRNNNTVYRYSLAGVPDASWTTPTVSQPIGVEVDESSNLWVTSDGTETLKVFNSQATPIATVGPAKNYQGIVLSGPGTIAATEYSDDLVRVFTTSGAAVTQWSVPGLPLGLAYGNGVYYVGDYNSSLLGIYNENGVAMGLPWAIAAPALGATVALDGTLYVCGAGPVQRYTPAGVLQVQWGSFQSYGVALDAAGKIYVADYNYGIRVFSFTP